MRFRPFFEVFFLLFVVSFFLKLGADLLELPAVEAGYLALFAAGCLCLFDKHRPFDSLKSLTALFFLAFFLYELVRAGWSFWHIAASKSSLAVMPRFQRYVSSVIPWLLNFGFFFLGLLQFKTRPQVSRFLWLLSLGGFLLAIATIPPLLIKGSMGYEGSDGRTAFFPSFVYFHPLVSKYFVSCYAHPNYVGDVIALGFFPAAGLLFYSLQRFAEALKSGKEHARPSVSSLGLLAIFTGAEALAIILLFSRGTIICFVSAFLVFLVAVSAKYFSRVHLGIALVVLAVVSGFLIWAANLRATWKEVASSKKEVTTSNENTSFGTNREGAHRAVAIYRAFPVLGVGRKGYASVAKVFSTPQGNHNVMSDFQAQCHYLEVLAEEGLGAWLYFLFIVAYFLESVWGLVRTKSRFQFVSGLSLAATVFMVLLHAGVKPVMEFFAIAAPTYLFMGASLAVLREDFAHA